MWSIILNLCSDTSIIFPTQQHLFKWALISSNLEPHERQDQRFLWYEIYSTYLPIIKRTHYFPESLPKVYASSFKSSFSHRIRTAHVTYLHNKNAILASGDSKSQEKLDALREQFMKTWHHPSIATMDDDDTIELHAFNQIETTQFQDLVHKHHKDMIQKWCDAGEDI